jgi:DNA primase
LAISKDIIENIKSRVNISDIIGEYLPLVKKGKNFFSKCPFHQDKTPSFSVSDEKKMYHCFGCHASGDVFKFLMEFSNISYPEAVSEVALKAGIRLERGNIAAISRKANLDNTSLEINSIAAEKYFENLKEESPAYEYILKRKLDKHDINNFKLGFAPESWDFILKHLRAKNYTDESIKHSSVVGLSDKTGNLYDRFRNKLIFPIINEKDNVTGFGSRVLDDSLPKYINSPETSLFNKKKVLYGINIAKNHFMQKGYAIICEGYFDVIACHKFGFDTAVATLGTAMSKEHMQILSRHKIKDIYLVFDADDAGIKACFRAITLSSEFDFNMRIISLDKGNDPMDFLTIKGRDAFIERMEKALSPIDFVVNVTKANFNLNDAEGKLHFVNHIFSYITAITNGMVKDRFLSKLSDVTGIDELSIRREYSRNIKPQFNYIKKTVRPDKEVKLEKQVLFLLLANKELFIEYHKKIHSDFFTDDFCSKAYKSTILYYDKKGKYDTSEIINTVSDVIDSEEDKIYFSDELFKEIYAKEPRMKLEQVFKELKLLKIENRLNENYASIKESEKSGSTMELSALFGEQAHLTDEKKKLKEEMEAARKY